jgi:hypothetical protein
MRSFDETALAFDEMALAGLLWPPESRLIGNFRAPVLVRTVAESPAFGNG